MKNQAIFSSKDKSKKLKCPLLQFLFGALRVRTEAPGFAQIACMRTSRCKLISLHFSCVYGTGFIDWLF